MRACVRPYTLVEQGALKTNLKKTRERERARAREREIMTWGWKYMQKKTPKKRGFAFEKS
jgi:hypothetical protein